MTERPELTPSPEWTASERMQVAFYITEQLESLARNGLVLPRVIIDHTQRIQLALSMPAAFLEANRQQVLEGLIQTPPGSASTDR